MPFTEISLDTLECGTSKKIVVDNPIVKLASKAVDIKFKNQLADNADAVVEFFPLNDKGGSAIGGFCDGMTGTELQVPGSGNTFCTPTIDGNFAYTVTAASHDDLDPVLIIEPQLWFGYRQMQDSPDYPVPGDDVPVADGGVSAAPMLLAGLVVGAVLGILIGRKLR